MYQPGRLADTANNPRILTINGGSSSIKFALFEAGDSLRRILEGTIERIGLDTLVFAGGIGENAPIVRTWICEGLEFLGIALEEKRNAANEGVISAEASRVSVRVIRTDEEWMIAKTVCRVLGLTIQKKHAHEEGV